MYPKGSSLEIRHDLVDCEIAICSTDLLDIFTDNFDKANLKDGFINWMQESEVLEDRTRAFEVMDQNAYFGRIFNPRTYAVVSNDVICRRVYPLVLDRSAIDPKSSYLIKMPNIYIEKRAHLHVTTQILNNVSIGQSTEIDANSMVTFSTIASNCKIGKNVRIINSIIGKGVVIGDNCNIIGSILWDKVGLESGVTVQGGCTIAKGV